MSYPHIPIHTTKPSSIKGDTTPGRVNKHRNSLPKKKYLKFFLFSLQENISRPPPSPLCFPQVKPQVSKYPLPPLRFSQVIPQV